MTFATHSTRREKKVVIDATPTNEQDVYEALSQRIQSSKKTIITKIKKIRMLYEFEKTIAKSMIF